MQSKKQEAFILFKYFYPHHFFYPCLWLWPFSRLIFFFHLNELACYSVCLCILEREYDWKSKVFFVDRGLKEHTLKSCFLKCKEQFLSHIEVCIKIKKRQNKHTIMSTVESTCKCFTWRIITTTDSTFVSPCLWIQNMITACLLQKTKNH